MSDSDDSAAGDQNQQSRQRPHYKPYRARLGRRDSQRILDRGFGPWFEPRHGLAQSNNRAFDFSEVTCKLIGVYEQIYLRGPRVMRGLEISFSGVKLV